MSNRALGSSSSVRSSGFEGINVFASPERHTRVTRLLQGRTSMDWGRPAWYLLVSAAGVAAGYVIVRLTWWVASQWQIRRAGPRRLLATRHRIWHHPDASASSALRFGPGGRDGVPAPPFRFIEELFSGSQPCVAVSDARTRRWRVKWGHEAKPESFAVRVAWACGYFAEVTHFIAEGTIDAASSLTRARKCIDQD